MMIRKGLIAAAAALAISAPVSAHVSFSAPFNPGGFPVPNPHPRPAVIGNMGFTEPIIPLQGFFNSTGPVFFDETGGAVFGPAQVPAPVPLTGNTFVPLTPQTGGTPIGAAGVSGFGPVMNGGTGFVPVTNQALPNQQLGTGLPHRSPIQSGTGIAAAPGAVGGGFVAVTPDAVAVQPLNAIPRTSDLVDARILSDGKLRVRWNGWNQAVDYGTVALLDKNRNVIRSVEITQPPLQATFALTNKSAYYQVVIHYMNGTVTSIVSPV